MEQAIHFVATLLPILYGLAGLAYVLIFFLRGDPVARKLGPRTLGFTVLLHLAYVALLTVHLRRVPIATSFESLSALALSLAIVYLVQEKRSGTPYTGLLFVPLVFVCQTLSSAFVNPSVEIKPVLQSPMFGLHIAGVLLGYSAFAVAAIYGFLYLMLYHELRAHRFGLVYERLPSLEVLSSMNLRAAGFGLGCLTLGLVAGALMSLRSPELLPRFWGDPKLWLSVFGWFLYSTCLLVRYLGGWRGVRIAYFTIAGFLLLVFSMLAANRLFNSSHDFRI